MTEKDPFPISSAEREKWKRPVTLSRLWCYAGIRQVLPGSQSRRCPEPHRRGQPLQSGALNAKTLQKALYVGFFGSDKPLQVVWLGWSSFPVPGPPFPSAVYSEFPIRALTSDLWLLPAGPFRLFPWAVPGRVRCASVVGIACCHRLPPGPLRVLHLDRHQAVVRGGKGKDRVTGPGDGAARAVDREAGRAPGMAAPAPCARPRAGSARRLAAQRTGAQMAQGG